MWWDEYGVYVIVVVVIVVLIPILCLIWRYIQGGQFRKNVRIDGKVTIITGSNSGIGKMNAMDFARRGAHVYMACRNTNSAEAVRDEIVKKTNNQNVFVMKLDLSSLQSVRDFVKDFRGRETRLDLLINNAGVMALPERQLTVDGNEMQFGTNHLGPFLLTNLLLEPLKAAAPSRIVNVSSIAHTFPDALSRDNLNSEKEYTPYGSYGQSKLAMVMCTRELAKRLSGSRVTANSLHPGAVRTEIARHHSILSVIMRPFSYVLLKTPHSGMQTQLAVALDPALEGVTGKYFSDCKVKKESKAARDDEAAAWLWQYSAELTGLAETV